MKNTTQNWSHATPVSYYTCAVVQLQAQQLPLPLPLEQLLLPLALPLRVHHPLQAVPCTVTQQGEAAGPAPTLRYRSSTTTCTCLYLPSIVPQLIQMFHHLLSCQLPQLLLPLSSHLKKIQMIKVIILYSAVWCHVMLLISFF